jgi:ABC-type antimicrobial peptide transport system permease subunit
MTLGEAEMSLRPDVGMPDAESLLEQPGSVWRIAGRRFFQRKVGIVGLILVSFMILVAVFAPLIAPYDPYQNFIGQPGAERWAPPCVNALDPTLNK